MFLPVFISIYCVVLHAVTKFQMRKLGSLTVIICHFNCGKKTLFCIYMMKGKWFIQQINQWETMQNQFCLFIFPNYCFTDKRSLCPQYLFQVINQATNTVLINVVDKSTVLIGHTSLQQYNITAEGIFTRLLVDLLGVAVG